MPEREDGELRGSPGMTRRDLLRRGAIVGGGLLWATPTVQSIAKPAYAQTPACHACCQCNEPNQFRQVCALDTFSELECELFCALPPGNFVVKYDTGTECVCVTGQICECTGDDCFIPPPP
ncbi:MAG: hypothetical protein ACRDGU_00395 [Actinomycetota bacterium]